MKNHLSLIAQSPLFHAISPDVLQTMLLCVGAHSAHIGKGEFIYAPDMPISELALLLEGSVTLSNEDFFGNKNVLEKILPGELFGEAYAALHTPPLMNVQANEECEVLFIPIEPITSPCPKACAHHAKLIQNLLALLAEHNQQLVLKFSHISKRTTREKLLSYLYQQAKLQQSRTFTIALNRQELADYLFVERSAMSHELGKLRDEGYLSFHRNSFKLLK